jgi:hypothetical protein
MDEKRFMKLRTMQAIHNAPVDFKNGLNEALDEIESKNILFDKVCEQKEILFKECNRLASEISELEKERDFWRNNCKYTQEILISTCEELTTAISEIPHNCQTCKKGSEKCPDINLCIFTNGSRWEWNGVQDKGGKE